MADVSANFVRWRGVAWRSKSKERRAFVVLLAKEDIEAIAASIEADPSVEITLDVENERIRVGDQSYTAVVRETARKALCEGKWDMIGELKEGESQVAAVVGKLRYMAR